MPDACRACLFLDFSCSRYKVVFVKLQSLCFTRADIRSDTPPALIVCEIHL